MKSFDTELKKYAEKVNLKVSERHELRERILSYMEYHPLPKQLQTFKKADFTEGISSESFTTLHFNFNTQYVRIGGGIFAVLLILAPFVAERSVPGDALYLVKTGFNESIQGQLVNTPYEKIEFETKLMERRIGEARELASVGKLTEEVKTQIAEDVREHTDAVQDGLALLRTQDADGAAIAQIAFSSSLEVQSAVLGVNESTNGTSSIDSILSAVNEAHDEVVSNQVEEKPSFEGLIAQAEIETTRAYELFTSVKVSATTEEIIDIERRLSDIDRLILEAKEKYKTETEIAVNDLTTTLGLSQKLIAFMTDIDIRETVTLESLVPVVLSDTERITLVQTNIAEVNAIVDAVNLRLPKIGDIGAKGKIEDGIATITELLIQSSTALEGNNIDGAEKQMIEAKAFATDIDMLSQHMGILIPDEEVIDGEVPTEVTLPSEEEEVGSTTTQVGTTSLSI